MANEPSLGELANMRVDSEQGTGTPAVVFDSSNLYRRLDAAQQQIAQNKKQKYQQFLGNLKELYKGIGDAADLDIMTQDRPVLQKQMADLFSKIESDPRSALGGQGYAELQQGLAKLRFDSTESAKNNLFDKAHREFLARDPDLNTPENKTKLEAFGDQPLGARKAYELDMPGLFDPVTLGKGIAASIKQDYADTKLSDDGKFVETVSGTRYPEEQWDAVAGNLYELPDPRSGSLRNTMQQRFKALPPKIKEKYEDAEDPAKAYFLDVMKSVRPGDQVKKAGDKANPFALLDKRNLNALAMEGIREGNREKLAKVRMQLNLEGLDGNSDFLLRQYAGIVGNKTGQFYTHEIGGAKVKEEQVDLPANILKSYAQTEKETLREGSSLDPVSETISSGTLPDVTTRTKDGNIRVVFYKHYKQGDKNIPKDKKVGDIVESSTGNAAIERTGIIPKRNLLAVLGKGVVQSKMLANAIDAADVKLKGRGNDYIDKVASGEEEAPKKQEKTYRLKNVTYTETQVEKAAKASNMTVDEYKKAVGLKE